MTTGKNVFNIRVYALIINDNDELLVAEEYHYNTYMLKLPGGGLDFGEGLRDGLLRELREELNIEVQEAEHFYTTDFFIESVFNPDQQVIAVYYKVTLPENLTEMYRDHYEKPSVNGQVEFRWISAEELHPSMFTFPADRAAITELCKLIKD